MDDGPELWRGMHYIMCSQCPSETHSAAAPSDYKPGTSTFGEGGLEFLESGPHGAPQGPMAWFSRLAPSCHPGLECDSLGTLNRGMHGGGTCEIAEFQAPDA
ncbi:hypothetical protein GHT09_015858 [Marmota monax]|uniref:Uncharacterized protein n=1 Tax=Marmota monax TaxID=9995 RepID=A0A834Q9Y3_MARMO|nr:hypothetical protein GHT09_015858 [Marmota monax]